MAKDNDKNIYVKIKEMLQATSDNYNVNIKNIEIEWIDLSVQGKKKFLINSMAIQHEQHFEGMDSYTLHHKEE